MTYVVKRSELAGLGLNILTQSVTAFKKALAEHGTTEGVPAPTAHPIVEEIVRKHDGEFGVEDDLSARPGQALDDRITVAETAIGREDRIAALEQRLNITPSGTLTERVQAIEAAVPVAAAAARTARL